MARFDEIAVGDSAELIHVLTQNDIDRFVDLTGDNNRLHVDARYAEATALKKPVAHGMLGASFISTVIGTKLPGDGALWYSQTLDFLLPVRLGDQITVRAEVIKKHEGNQTLELATEIFNQHRQKVTAGTAKVKIVEREFPKAVAAEPEPRKKVALIIGGSGGIGTAVARQLARDGFRVALHYFSNEAHAAKVRSDIVDAGLEAAVFRADVTQQPQVVELVAQVLRWGEAIDVLVNCATVKIPAIELSRLEWSDLQAHLDVNIRTSFYLIKALLPVLKRGSRIVNLTTQYIENAPPSQLLPYVTAKSALHGFSKALAVELAPQGIAVNMVSPGMTETDLILDVPEKTKMLQAARTPLRRLARPEDVAYAVSFLASERAAYVTGETIRVSGGQVML